MFKSYNLNKDILKILEDAWEVQRVEKEFPLKSVVICVLPTTRELRDIKNEEIVCNVGVLMVEVSLANMLYFC